MTENATIAPESLPAIPAERIDAIAKQIDLNDPTLTITYGAQTMTEIAKFADSLLERVRAKDAGPVGETLTDLMVKVKDINIEELSQDNQGILERLPLIGGLFNSMEKTMARFQTLTTQVEGISNKLDDAMVGLLRDVEVLEQLYVHNEHFYEDLSAYIEAGKQRLAQAREVDLPKLKEEAEQSGDSMTAQKVRDLAERLNRFERRLHDLQLSRTITVQSAPQIRLIQSNNQALAEKIQTSIVSTIPIWKSQMVLALSLHGQKKAAQLQKNVSDTTNELLRKNAEMLESATMDTAREVERSVVDIATLRDVHKRLISTIEQTLQIAEEGRERRASVEKELEVMEGDLRTRLTALAVEKSSQAIEAASGQQAIEASIDGQNNESEEKTQG